MKLKSSLVSLVSILVLVIASPATAASQKSTKKAPVMDEKAMMDAWMKAATPGPAHKQLAEMEGTWDAKVSTWMKPGDPAQISNGVSDNKLVLGGRYLQQTYTGNFMGQPFNGLGYTGYDNVSKKYVSTWMDDMGTGIMMSSGASVMKMSGSVNDPMTGKTAMVSSKLSIADADHHTMEMWGPAPDGKMYRTMEISYSRKK